MRTYGPMKRRSEKVKDGEAEFQAVYRLVDQRSEGRCEFTQAPEWGPPDRCLRRATDHHHILKPRRSHHDEALIVHLCRVHHDRCEWPYQRGRLIVTAHPMPGRFLFAIRFASGKFAAREACEDCAHNPGLCDTHD